VAQTPDSAIVRGQVWDQSHAVLVGVEIKIVNTLNGAGRRATTDSSGKFSLAGLPAGSYTLTTHKDGFADLNRDLTISAGTTADLKLELNVSSEQTQVVVTGTVGEICTDQPQLGDILGLEQVQTIPLLARRITYLPLLNAANRPAINQGDVFMNQNLFTTNGSGRRQTSWVVDGQQRQRQLGQADDLHQRPLAGCK
jgi:hypothetical protein